MNDFATMKVRSDVHRWMKAEAARRDVPMYKLLEDIIEDSFGRRTWERALSGIGLIHPPDDADDGVQEVKK